MLWVGIGGAGCGAGRGGAGCGAGRGGAGCGAGRGAMCTLSIFFIDLA